MKKILTIILIIMLVSIVGCKEPTTPTNPITEPAEPKPVGEEMTKLDMIEANNKFAFDLYSKIDEETNIFFSPYSITTAVGMLAEGARGNTLEEVKNVFYLTGENKNAVKEIITGINADKEYTLKTANALWMQKEWPFYQEYLKLVNENYFGELNEKDYIKEAEKSRQEINKWVEDKTEEKIKDLLPPGSINQMTRFVLTNAIYFKGDWQLQFEKEKTTKMDFEGKNVDMMRMYDEEFKYSETEEMQIISMPYEGDMEMKIILPKTDLDSLEITYDNYNLWNKRLGKRTIDELYIPKFKFTKDTNLGRTLQEMGMKEAFTTDADFTGITDQDLFVSGVFHKAFVDVNEEGTEAAAATGIVFETTSIGPPEEKIVFKADKPFLFTIEKEGNILFMGKVIDPTK